jgi:thiamine pyrophosphokinase
VTVTVDGGTNRWLKWLRQYNLEKKLKHPKLITGDLDSCKRESIEFFSESEVIQTVDQDATDFTKSLLVIEPLIGELDLKYIVAVCETSGRLDQILANINTLYLNLQNSSSKPVFLLSSNSLSWLLPSGENIIAIPDNLRHYWCSLVPFQPSTIVTTSGLKWNLDEHEIVFGGMVSTSNTYEQNSTKNVRIITNKPVLWSMGISTIDDN